MARKSITEKVLVVIDGLMKEIASEIYPYKGIGRNFKKYEGSLSKAIYDISKRGYLERVEIDNEKYLRFTKKGQLKIIQGQKLKNWDGFWRIIAFDIEETRKKTRNVFRSKITELGCKPIQKSVWITPNDISEDLEKLLDILDLENNVDYFVSRAVTGEEKYLKMFGITKNSKN